MKFGCFKYVNVYFREDGTNCTLGLFPKKNDAIKCAKEEIAKHDDFKFMRILNRQTMQYTYELSRP